MPHNIPIVLEDIAEVGESLDCDFSDEYRQEALQCKVCRDIQACPGSGKTTLLVAKLAILSKKWRWKDRGICVLSHTNVARKEVERKLADHLTAHHLLSYPHFVGTIQVFVDRFLALPFLRNAGVDVATVGNDRFASRVWTLISEYDYLRTYLNRRPYNARKVLPTLRYEGANLELGSAGGGIPFGEHTATFKELLRLKKRISREGIFRYDDMFAFAEAYLSRYLDLSKVVSERFPWVFVDEMQDTSLIQASLLDRLFTTSVVQRLGDINQAIFEEGDEDTDSQTGFPLSNAISLPQSKRFGPAIASWATNLTVVDYQNIEGRPDCRKRNHTIFLFDADSILQVLPSFGELVSETYSGEVWGEFPIKIVGYRKSPPSERDVEKIPYDIRDYWPHFQPYATSKSSRPRLLVGFVREARRILKQEGQWHPAYKLLVEGVLEFLRRQEVENEAGLAFTRARLIETLRTNGEKKLLGFRQLLLDWGMHQPLDEEFWKQSLCLLNDLLPQLKERPLLPSAQDFLDWIDIENSQGYSKIIRVEENLVNVYQVEDNNGSPINIEVTTIHSAKGETHLATLVLETYWYDHDLQEIVPFLIDQGDRKVFKKVRTRKRAKRIFVGMTRPRELLCLAINKNHLHEDQIEALDDSGWTIQDLTTNQTKTAP